MNPDDGEYVLYDDHIAEVTELRQKIEAHELTIATKVGYIKYLKETIAS